MYRQLDQWFATRNVSSATTKTCYTDSSDKPTIIAFDADCEFDVDFDISVAHPCIGTLSFLKHFYKSATAAINKRLRTHNNTYTGKYTV